MRYSQRKHQGRTEGSLREWSMAVRDKEDIFLFTTMERGKLKEKVTEAEEWLDNTFNRILNKYGVELYKEIMVGENHVRR